MKTEINVLPLSAFPEYPALYQSDSGRVVLMSSPGIGTVMYDPTAVHMVGHYAHNWAMDCFTKITSPVTITFLPQEQ